MKINKNVKSVLIGALPVVIIGGIVFPYTLIATVPFIVGILLGSTAALTD